MSTLAAAIWGIAIQALGLGAFAFVASRARYAWSRDAVLVVTVASMATLLVRFNWSFRLPRCAALSAILALGYLGAYALLGLTAYRSLLKDLEVLSVEACVSLLRVLVVVFALYFVFGILVGLVGRAVAARRR